MEREKWSFDKNDILQHCSLSAKKEKERERWFSLSFFFVFPNKYSNINSKKYFTFEIMNLCQPFILINVIDLLTSDSSIIENLRISLRDKEGLINQKTNADQGAETPAHDHIKQLTILVCDKDQQLQVNLLKSPSPLYWYFWDFY